MRQSQKVSNAYLKRNRWQFPFGALFYCDNLLDLLFFLSFFDWSHTQLATLFSNKMHQMFLIYSILDIFRTYYVSQAHPPKIKSIPFTLSRKFVRNEISHRNFSPFYCLEVLKYIIFIRISYIFHIGNTSLGN